LLVRIWYALSGQKKVLYGAHTALPANQM